MKKQEEIFHEIQDMMGETKEGRIRWSVEVQTTEANPVEEKPVEHEDGLDWTIDEWYVSKDSPRDLTDRQHPEDIP